MSKKDNEKKTKKMITRHRIHISEQWKDFNSQSEAINAAIKLLQTNLIYFMRLERVKFEEEL